VRVPEEAAPDAAGIREVAGAFAIAARQPAEAEEATRRHLRSVIAALLENPGHEDDPQEESR